MIFASRTPESMNTDPHPNVWEGHSPRDQMRADIDMFRKGAPLRADLGYHHRPRPEYTPKTTHSANPILAAFRRWDIAPVDALETLQGYSITYDHINDWCDEWEDAATPDQIDHASRVLSRLAEFRK